MRNNKAPGLDKIPVELLKLGGQKIIDLLFPITQRVYNGEPPPWQWRVSKIVPIPKKGDPSLMSNYRGISLMSVAAKVYNRILLNRIRAPVEKILRKNQSGFRPGRSTAEPIAAVRRLLETARTRQLPLVITFVDFRKAFDSVSRPVMFAILRHYGIPQRIVNAIASLYNESSAVVFADGQTSDQFSINTGVLQGDVLAPYLFIIVMDYILANSTKGNGIGFEYRPRRSRRDPARFIADLDFADDVALIESSVTRTNTLLKQIYENAKACGLEINTEKTEHMRININDPLELKLGDEKIKQVDDFRYLGSQIGSTSNDISKRIANAWVAFWQLTKIWRAPNIELSLKTNIFTAAVVSILLYGCESWVTTSNIENQLNVFGTKCLRIILRISLLDRVSNTEIYKRAGLKPIAIMARKRQLKWLGHALRREPDDPAKIFALYEPASSQGRAKPGRTSNEL